MIFIYLFVAIIYIFNYNDPSPAAETKKEIAYYFSFLILTDIAIQVWMKLETFFKKK